MNQEKKNSIKWIATFMAIIVLFAGVGAALGLVIQQMKQNNTDTPIASGDGKNMFEGQIYEMPSVLAFSADATTASDSGHTASVTLTATVLPVEATNKLVDWSVAWGVTKQHGSENVTDYVTVTPKSDGSNIATVTCKKAFGDDEIIVTVTTREGGFSAKCQVLYVGAPTSIKVTSPEQKPSPIAIGTTQKSWKFKVPKPTTLTFLLTTSLDLWAVRSLPNTESLLLLMAQSGLRRRYTNREHFRAQSMPRLIMLFKTYLNQQDIFGLRSKNRVDM